MYRKVPNHSLSCGQHLCVYLMLGNADIDQIWLVTFVWKMKQKYCHDFDNISVVVVIDCMIVVMSASKNLKTINPVLISHLEDSKIEVAA